MALFSFDVGLQRAILRLMQVDDMFCMRALEHVEAGFFSHEALGWSFKVIKQYWDSYSTCCGDVPLREALAYVDRDKLAYYSAEVEGIIALGLVRDAEFVKDKLSDFCKRNLFSIAHQESARLFNENKSDDAYEVMARAQDRIREVTFDDVDRQWFFEELPERQRQRHRNQLQGWQAFSTGIPQLDKSTEGGVQPGQVWSVLAYPKRGKTTFLINQGLNAIRMRSEPVLHIILEGRGDQISARYDSAFSNELYTKVKLGEINPQVLRILQEEYRRLRELLVIRTMNDWDVNCLAIKGEMEEVKVRNFRPSLLIVDYVDLLRSRYRCDSETKHQVEASRDLKRLVNQTDVACWTAWQAQRPKPNAHEKEHILTSGNVADAYAKVRIVDSYGSLNMTNDEKKKGEMRVYWEDHRDAPVNKCWLVQNDLSRMKMVTEILSDDLTQQKDDAPPADSAS